MIPYEFKPDDASRFASEQHAKVRTKGDELQFKHCPYCHGSGKDNEWSFAVNLKTGMFKCLRATCGAKGNMLTLHKDFGFDLGVDVREYERPAFSWRRFNKPEKPVEPSDHAIEYLGKRGISEEVVRQYEVTTKRDDPELLLFPFFNEDGVPETIKYRHTEPDKKPKEFSEKDCRMILFGIKQCDPTCDQLILTEGQIDSLSVATAGYKNAVSVPNGKNGMTWIPHCWDWLHKYSRIVVFGDYEHGNMTLLADVSKRFKWMQVKAVRPEDYHECKDANEILQKYGVDGIRQCIENAEPLMLEQVKLLSEISYDDGAHDEVLPTGIKAIDRRLYGGLRLGYLDILTGKRGEGKSTFGSQIMRAALEAGYITFVYSGEMPKGDVRKWLDMQIAGDNRVYDEYENDQSKGYPKYTLSKSNSETIRMWYKDRAYIYDTAVITETKADLLSVIETYITQFGVRFVLVDNLMTAIDLIDFDGNKYEKQEYICKQLARMASTYNVLILLIAHKKKEGYGNDDDNDNVSGSSEITNLAGIVISYGKGTKADYEDGMDNSQRKIKITKNRLSGECELKGFVSSFSPASKRIYITDDELMKPSKCFENEGFVSVDDMTDEIPW